jgi:hypothetical protein
MKIGLTQAEVDEYFSGPAFLAWFQFFSPQKFSLRSIEKLYTRE